MGRVIEDVALFLPVSSFSTGTIEQGRLTVVA
jgi:hypothetical protein